MKRKKECAICAHLSTCKEVTEQQVLHGHSCQDWHLAGAEELSAREQIIEEFGSEALRYALPTKQPISAKLRSRRRRKHV